MKKRRRRRRRRRILKRWRSFCFRFFRPVLAGIRVEPVRRDPLRDVVNGDVVIQWMLEWILVWRRLRGEEGRWLFVVALERTGPSAWNVPSNRRRLGLRRKRILEDPVFNSLVSLRSATPSVPPWRRRRITVIPSGSSRRSTRWTTWWRSCIFSIICRAMSWLDARDGDRLVLSTRYCDYVIEVIPSYDPEWTNVWR